MNTLNTYPCCSNSLIHYFGNHREYWFCRHCWSEMPNLEDSEEAKQPRFKKIVNLSTSFSNVQPIDISKLAMSQPGSAIV